MIMSVKNETRNPNRFKRMGEPKVTISYKKFREILKEEGGSITTLHKLSELDSVGISRVYYTKLLRGGRIPESVWIHTTAVIPRLAEAVGPVDGERPLPEDFAGLETGNVAEEVSVEERNPEEEFVPEKPMTDDAINAVHTIDAVCTIAACLYKHHLEPRAAAELSVQVFNALRKEGLL